MLTVLIAVACIAIILYVGLALWPLVLLVAAVAAVGFVVFWLLVIFVFPMFWGTASEQDAGIWFVSFAAVVLLGSIVATMIRDRSRHRDTMRRIKQEQAQRENT